MNIFLKHLKHLKHFLNLKTLKTPLKTLLITISLKKKKNQILEALCHLTNVREYYKKLEHRPGMSISHLLSNGIFYYSQSISSLYVYFEGNYFVGNFLQRFMEKAVYFSMKIHLKVFLSILTEIPKHVSTE